jgi:hypothetical protein
LLPNRAGTTIDAITLGGGVKLFAHIDATKLPGPCPGGVGLTTALVVRRSGWVILGSLPTSDGMAATAKAGCLIVLNRFGQPVETFSGGEINGPWDMTALDLDRVAVPFVTNVLNGTVARKGNIVRNGTVLGIVLSLPDESESESENMVETTPGGRAGRGPGGGCNRNGRRYPLRISRRERTGWRLLRERRKKRAVSTSSLSGRAFGVPCASEGPRADAWG